MVCDNGKIFFFKFIKKIIGNFSFLVVCNVIKVICEEFFFKLFKLEIKVKFVKKFVNFVFLLFGLLLFCVLKCLLNFCVIDKNLFKFFK